MLLRDNVDKKNFKMSFIFINQLIQQWVISIVYKFAPTISISQTDDGSLKTLNTLKESSVALIKLSFLILSIGYLKMYWWKWMVFIIIRFLKKVFMIQN